MVKIKVCVLLLENFISGNERVHIRCNSWLNLALYSAQNIKGIIKSDNGSWLKRLFNLRVSNNLHCIM